MKTRMTLKESWLQSTIRKWKSSIPSIFFNFIRVGRMIGKGRFLKNILRRISRTSVWNCLKICDARYIEIGDNIYAKTACMCL